MTANQRWTKALVERRKKRSLYAIEAAAAELLCELTAQNRDFSSQPGAVVFPKKIFITEEGSTPLPDGRSLSYLETVQVKWDEFVAKSEKSSKLDFSETLVRMLQQVVIDAHVLERRLLERIKESS